MKEDPGAMTPEEIEKKRNDDLAVVLRMIEIYCRGQHREARARAESEGPLEHFTAVKTGLCPECAQLADYVIKRVEVCPVIDQKTFCSSCTVHCYAPEQREQIRTVMRYAGPRMLWYDPPKAIAHLADTLAAKRAAQHHR